jgi:DNA repair protein RadC
MSPMPTEKHVSVKLWSPEDRPREKMLQKGSSNITDTELLAILLGSGTRNETVIELAHKLLFSAKNNLNELSRLSINDLMKIKGIGEAKALVIAAAFELGKRHGISDLLHKDKILTSHNIAEIFQAKLGAIPHEEFWLVLLNRSNKIIDKIKISQGGISGTVADIRIMMKEALEKLASAIILCHNHPSGNIQPSEQDISLTKKIKEAGLLMDISLLDHVIVSAKNEYFSFADEGLL